MDYSPFKKNLGRRLSYIRQISKLTQEQLAELVNKTTEHISYIERGERSPSFELLIDLSNALSVSLPELMDFFSHQEKNVGDVISQVRVKPVSPEAIHDQNFQAIDEPVKPETERQQDLERLQEALEGVLALQRLANEYGIHDIFQDNGGKVIQLLIILGLKQTKGREGNDAIDDEGNEYELKTINVKLRGSSAGVTTHHHLNRDILDKYRKVKAWYIGIYQGIELAEIWEVSPSLLEGYFSEWEEKIIKENIEINNPKISLKVVRMGKLVYPEWPVLDEFFQRKSGKKDAKTKKTQPHLPGLE